jgi:predicted hydrocarbon binding protein/predicted transcriptional regulator
MESTQGFIKTLLDPLTMQIVQLAVRENLYPNEIAKRVGKSNSLVVKRLKALERRGVLQGYFTTEGGRAVKKYRLASDELQLKVNFISGNVDLIKSRRQPFEEIVSSRPELFKSYKDYCFWLSAKAQPKEVASLLKTPEHDAAKLAQNIKDNLEDAFIIAHKVRLENWKNSAEGVYFTLVSDYAVIPTHRLNKEAPGMNKRLLERLSRGEALLSTLRRELPGVDNLEKQIEELSKSKMVLLEEKTLPLLNCSEINRLTKQRLKEKHGPQQLHSLGRDVGEKVASLLGGDLDDALLTLFPGAMRKKTLKGERISIRECAVGKGAKKKSCYFIAGVLEALFESRGIKLTVTEEVCRANGAKACIFTVTPKGKQIVKGTMRVKELLG